MRATFTAIVFTLALAILGLIVVPSAMAESSNRNQHRLLYTTDATVVEPGQVELMLGLSYLRGQGRRAFDNNWGIDSGREKARIYDWRLDLRYGLAEDLDLYLNTGWVDIKDHSMPFGDVYGRGMDDLAVGVKYVFWRDGDGFSVAYQPGLTIPVGRAAESGRLGPGQKHWSVDQTLAATQDWDRLSGSVSLSHSIPFGEGRDDYARPFLTEAYDTRGTTGFDLGLVYTDLPVQPLVELNYAHEWIRSGSQNSHPSASETPALLVNGHRNNSGLIESWVKRVG